MAREAPAMLEVVRAGALTTIQDLGRAGHAHLGVPRSGAADAGAHRRANAAVGNPPEAATLETTLLGCTVRARDEVALAVEGARCDVFVGGVRAPWGAPFRVRRGQVVEVGPAHAGLRSYVAVSGGIDVPPVLGSRATDTLSGMGPAPVQDGDLLPVGASAERPSPARLSVRGLAHGPEPASAGVVEVVAGPRQEWLSLEGWEALALASWRVGAQSNRVGVRLEGEPLARARDDEIPSEGIVTGAVQLPPSGLPVIFLPDHPTTGGYPVIAVATEAGIAAVAQARPGDTLRLEVRRDDTSRLD